MRRYSWSSARPHQVDHDIIRVLLGVHLGGLFFDLCRGTYRSALIDISFVVFIECYSLILLFILDVWGSAFVSASVNLALNLVLDRDGL